MLNVCQSTYSAFKVLVPRYKPYISLMSGYTPGSYPPEKHPLIQRNSGLLVRDLGISVED